MANYNRPPQPYGAPGSNQFGPPGMGAPGMGAPPFMGGPPNFGQAPGLQQAQQHNAGGYSQNFQPPPNMPNIDFGAPVIRLGLEDPARRDTSSARPDRFSRDGNAEPLGQRRGLGFDRGDQRRDGRRDFGRDGLSNFPPPSKEEVARTIWIANISDKFGGDQGLERILNAGQGLRRWRRCVGVDDKPATFGFAEYEDADSLNTAIEVLQDVRLPKLPKREQPSSKEDGKENTQINGDSIGAQNGDANPQNVKVEDTEDLKIEHNADQEGNIEMGNQDDNDVVKVEEDADNEQVNEEEDEVEKLVVIIDPLSRKYVEDWRARGSLQKEPDASFRIDSGKDDLRQILRSLAIENEEAHQVKKPGDTPMGGTEVTTENGTVVHIPIAMDDELSDIPQEARESVSREIALFRVRALERDKIRLKLKEEREQADRQRHLDQSMHSGIKDRPIEGVPLGPRSQRGPGVRQPYAVNFKPEEMLDDATEGTDEEIYAKKVEQKHAVLDQSFKDAMRYLSRHERVKSTANERMKRAEKSIAAKKAHRYNRDKRFFKEFDDVAEARAGHPFYRDPGQWYLNRLRRMRDREIAMDNEDREQWHQETDAIHARQKNLISASEAATDQFFAEQGEELDARARAQQEPARVKISFGVNAKKAETQQRRAAAVVENLLEDEPDEDENKTKRTLIPIQAGSANRMLSEEDSAVAARQLAAELPRDARGVFEWDVKWENIDDNLIEERLRSHFESKVLAYLGMADPEIVELMENTLRKRGKPGEIIEELTEVLEDDEAEDMVKAIWRMVIFFSEAGQRGISV